MVPDGWVIRLLVLLGAALLATLVSLAVYLVVVSMFERDTDRDR